MPPSSGYAAASGFWTRRPGTLFAILFLWQFPHFLAIAWMYREITSVRASLCCRRSAQRRNHGAPDVL